MSSWVQSFVGHWLDRYKDQSLPIISIKWKQLWFALMVVGGRWFAAGRRRKVEGNWSIINRQWWSLVGRWAELWLLSDLVRLGTKSRLATSTTTTTTINTTTTTVTTTITTKHATGTTKLILAANSNHKFMHKHWLKHKHSLLQEKKKKSTNTSTTTEQ